CQAALGLRHPGRPLGLRHPDPPLAPQVDHLGGQLASAGGRADWRSGRTEGPRREEQSRPPLYHDIKVPVKARVTDVNPLGFVNTNGHPICREVEILEGPDIGARVMVGIYAVHRLTRTPLVKRPENLGKTMTLQDDGYIVPRDGKDTWVARGTRVMIVRAE